MKTASGADQVVVAGSIVLPAPTPMLGVATQPAWETVRMFEVETRPTHVRVGGRYTIVEVAVPLSEFRQAGSARRREAVTITVFLDDEEAAKGEHVARRLALEKAISHLTTALQSVRGARP